MPTLMLLRHAKAEGHGRIDDFDRTLTERGKAEAAGLGDYLRASGPIPEFALVSSAKRTTQTFKGLARRLRASVPVRFEDALFNANASQLSDALRLVDPSVGCLLVVGHNPCIADAAADFAEDGGGLDLARLRSRFPPCGLAVITFPDRSWDEVRHGGGRLDAFVLPEDLPLR